MMDALTTLRALNYTQLRQLAAQNRLTAALDVQRDHACLDGVCDPDMVARVRAELAARGIDVGFDFSG